MKQALSKVYAISTQMVRFGSVISAIITGFLFVTLTPTNASAQDSTQFTLNVGYGIGALFFTPNLQNYSIYDFDTTTEQGSTRIEQLSTDLKIKPILVKFDLKITPKSSIGLQLIYNSFISSGTRIDSIWIPTSGTYSVEEYKTKYTMNRIRVQLTFTRHIQHKNPLFESYFYSGLGWSQKYRKYQVGNTYPNVSQAPVFDFIDFPISLRFAYGLRFNFAEHWGLQTEFGLGGPLFTIGLAAKF